MFPVEWVLRTVAAALRPEGSGPRVDVVPASGAILGRGRSLSPGAAQSLGGGLQSRAQRAPLTGGLLHSPWELRTSKRAVRTGGEVPDCTPRPGPWARSKSRAAAQQCPDHRAGQMQSHTLGSAAHFTYKPQVHRGTEALCGTHSSVSPSSTYMPCAWVNLTGWVRQGFTPTLQLDK